MIIFLGRSIMPAPKMKTHMSMLPNHGLILLRIFKFLIGEIIKILRDLQSPIHLGQFLSIGSWRFPFVQVILELLFQTPLAGRDFMAPDISRRLVMVRACLTTSMESGLDLDPALPSDNQVRDLFPLLEMDEDLVLIGKLQLLSESRASVHAVRRIV